jgi:hypothetical protein
MLWFMKADAGQSSLPSIVAGGLRCQPQSDVVQELLTLRFLVESEMGGIHLSLPHCSISTQAATRISLESLLPLAYTCDRISIRISRYCIGVKCRIIAGLLGRQRRAGKRSICREHHKRSQRMSIGRILDVRRSSY